MTVDRGREKLSVTRTRVGQRMGGGPEKIRSEPGGASQSHPNTVDERDRTVAAVGEVPVGEAWAAVGPHFSQPLEWSGLGEPGDELRKTSGLMSFPRGLAGSGLD